MSRKRGADAAAMGTMPWLRRLLATVDTWRRLPFHGVPDEDEAGREFLEAIRQIVSKSETDAPDR